MATREIVAIVDEDSISAKNLSGYLIGSRVAVRRFKGTMCSAVIVLMVTRGCGVCMGRLRCKRRRFAEGGESQSCGCALGRGGVEMPTLLSCDAEAGGASSSATSGGSRFLFREPVCSAGTIGSAVSAFGCSSGEDGGGEGSCTC